MSGRRHGVGKAAGGRDGWRMMPQPGSLLYLTPVNINKSLSEVTVFGTASSFTSPRTWVGGRILESWWNPADISSSSGDPGSGDEPLTLSRTLLPRQSSQETWYQPKAGPFSLEILSFPGQAWGWWPPVNEVLAGSTQTHITGQQSFLSFGFRIIPKWSPLGDPQNTVSFPNWAYALLHTRLMPSTGSEQFYWVSNTQ